MIDEGYIKFRSEWTRTAPLVHDQILTLVRWRKPLYDAGLIGCIAGTDIGFGNISVRAGMPGQFIISGTRTGCLEELGAEHFSLVTGYALDTNTVRCSGAAEASSEAMTHAALYDIDSQIRAVVHIHSEQLWAELRSSLPATQSSVAYGTPQMALELHRLYRESAFPQTGIAVMTGHEGGLIGFGNSMQQAAEKMLSLARNVAND